MVNQKSRPLYQDSNGFSLGEGSRHTESWLHFFEQSHSLLQELGTKSGYAFWITFLPIQRYSRIRCQGWIIRTAFCYSLSCLFRFPEEEKVPEVWHGTMLGGLDEQMRLLMHSQCKSNIRSNLASRNRHECLQSVRWLIAVVSVVAVAAVVSMLTSHTNVFDICSSNSCNYPNS